LIATRSVLYVTRLLIRAVRMMNRRWSTAITLHLGIAFCVMAIVVTGSHRLQKPSREKDDQDHQDCDAEDALNH
jgi:hypothetical protein